MLLLGDVNNQFYVDGCRLIRKSTGMEAGGFRKDGYRIVSINNKRYLSHRILYMIYHSKDYCDLPKFIDHVDGNVSNNLRDNLRECDSNTQNLYNCKPQKGTSKFKGVSWNGSSWVASIMHNRKSIYLGSYKNELEAADVYDIAANHYFGQYAKLNGVI